jgi:hypothetical protein
VSFPLRQLSEVFGAPGPWTTVYVDARHDTEDAARVAELTWRELRESLTKQGAPEDDLTALDAVIAAPSDVGGAACRYLLAGHGRVVRDEVMPGSPVRSDLAAHSQLPDVLPLVLHRSNDMPYVVVEAARDGANVSVRRASRSRALAEHAVRGQRQSLTKVQAGGWSHRRYQQHAEEVWAHNAAAVAQDVDRIVREAGIEMVVVSGDVRAREKLIGSLSPQSVDKLVEVDVHTRASGADHQALDDVLAERMDQLSETEERQALDRLATKAGDGQRASAGGLGATVDAFRQGQVQTLLLDPTALEDRHLLALDAAPWVALASDEVTGADVLAEAPATSALLRAGALTDAVVLFVEAERLARDDGVAALLRWPVGPARA